METAILRIACEATTLLCRIFFRKLKNKIEQIILEIIQKHCINKTHRNLQRTIKKLQKEQLIEHQCFICCLFFCFILQSIVDIRICVDQALSEF